MPVFWRFPASHPGRKDKRPTVWIIVAWAVGGPIVRDKTNVLVRRYEFKLPKTVSTSAEV